MLDAVEVFDVHGFDFEEIVHSGERSVELAVYHDGVGIGESVELELMHRRLVDVEHHGGVELDVLNSDYHG